MNIIGNIFLGVSALLFFGIVFILFNKESSQRSAGSAYVWSMLFLHLAFLVSMAIVTGIVGSKGGFAWIGFSGISRFLLLLFGLLFAVAGSCLSSFYKIELEGRGGLPGIVISLIVLLILSPLLWSGAILLNDSWRSTLPASAFRWPLVLAGTLGVLSVVVFTVILLVQERRNVQSKE